MIVDWLNDALGEGKPHHTQKGLQYNYQCPFCDDRKSRLFINVDREVYYCHNCEQAGSLITFISDYARIPWKEALTIYRGYRGYDKPLPEELENEIYTRLMGIKSVPQQKIVHPLPQEFILLEDAKGEVGKEAIKYWRSRGLTLQDAEKGYVGYCAEGNYANRIIMPDFEQGELVYWQGRTWEPTPTNPVLKKLFRKSMNPSLTKEQVEQGIVAVDKSEVVSNIDSVVDNGVAVIVEGKMDGYTVGDLGACIHGKHLSDFQLMKLVVNKDKIGTVVVMLDGDAFKQAVETADRLYRYFDDVLVCKLPNIKDDPNSLGRRKCLEVINDAIQYSPMFGVKAKLKGWY